MLSLLCMIFNDLINLGSALLCKCRTNWKFGCVDINLLVLAVVVSKNFSIPLFWKALLKKGNSNTAECIDILQLFVNTFGVECIDSLMADREFIGKVWIDFFVRKKSLFSFASRKIALSNGIRFVVMLAFSS